MEGFSKKEYLSLKMPTEEIPVSDQKRIELALNALGYDHVTFPLKVLPNASNIFRKKRNMLSYMPRQKNLQTRQDCCKRHIAAVPTVCLCFLL